MAKGRCHTRWSPPTCGAANTAEVAVVRRRLHADRMLDPLVAPRRLRCCVPSRGPSRVSTPGWACRPSDGRLFPRRRPGWRPVVERRIRDGHGGLGPVRLLRGAHPNETLGVTAESDLAGGEPRVGRDRGCLHATPWCRRCRIGDPPPVGAPRGHQRRRPSRRSPSECSGAGRCRN